MPKKAKSNSDDTQEWILDDALAAPNAALQAHADRKRRQRRRGRLILAGSALGAPALVISVLAWNAVGSAQLQSEPTEPTSPVVAPIRAETVSSPGRLAATIHLETWLATVPNPLPGARVVYWDGALERGEQDSTQAAGGMVHLTEETFTVLDGTGAAYSAQVLVATDPVGGGASVQSGPSLIPRTTSAAGLTVDSPWVGVDSLTAPEAVSAAVQGWAAAYTSGSPESLHIAVGDPSSERTYLPISGVASVQSQVSAGGAGSADGELIVRARLNLTWEGRGGDASPAAVEMDLLVHRADTGAPQVVAWGAPGSGPDLEPYINAVPVLNRSAPTGPDDPRYDDSGTAPTSAPTTAPEGEDD